MEAPFLYFTFHSAGKVVKYTRDGCFLDDQVLRGPLLGPGTLEFRQMAVGPHKELKNALYLAQAHPNPAIIVFGECALIEGTEGENSKKWHREGGRGRSCLLHEAIPQQAPSEEGSMDTVPRQWSSTCRTAGDDRYCDRSQGR